MFDPKSLLGTFMDKATATGTIEGGVAGALDFAAEGSALRATSVGVAVEQLHDGAQGLEKAGAALIVANAAKNGVEKLLGDDGKGFHPIADVAGWATMGLTFLATELFAGSKKPEPIQEANADTQAGAQLKASNEGSSFLPSFLQFGHSG